MNIKEILAKIKTNLGADASAEITGLLADAERQATDVLDSLSSANKESASRKARIRELETELETKTDELTKLSSTDNKAEIERLKKLETEYLAIQKAEQDKLVANWREKAKVFTDTPNTNPLFEKLTKLKDKFVLEGEITPEIAQKNLEAYSLLETAGVFTTPAPQSSGYPPATTMAETSKQSAPVTNSGADLFKQMK